MNNNRILAEYIFYILSLLLGGYIFYNIGMKNISTDIYTHAKIIKIGMEKTGTLPANFLYYLSVYILSGFSTVRVVLLRVSLLLLSISVFLKFYFSKILISKTLLGDIEITNSKIIILLLLIFLLLFIHPVITPFDIENGFYYLGKASINIWHNSTTIFAMPFVLMLFYFALEYIKEPKNKTLLYVLITGIINLLIKPSFLFVFVGAFPLFILLKYKFTNTTYKAIGISVLLTTFIVLQYFLIYYLNNIGEILYTKEASKVVIAPFEEWAHYSENILIDIITSIFFPLMLIILYYSKFKSNEVLKFSWLLFILAITVGILFQETGPRQWHWNFMWQVPMTNYLLFLITTTLYYKHLIENEIKLKDYILIFTFLLHFSSGVIYINRIVNLLNYR